MLESRNKNLFGYFGDDPTIVGYWPLDGRLIDLSRNKNHGTIVGGTVKTPGEGETAYYFDGSGDYITTGLSAYSWSAQSLTVMGWFWQDPSNPVDATWRNIICNRIGTIPNGWIGIASMGQASLQYMVVHFDGGSGYSTDRRMIGKGWHHLVGRYTWLTSTTSRVDVFMDGRWYAGGNGGSPATNPVGVSGGTFYIGEGFLAATQPWYGKIAHTAVFLRALTNAEVLGYYNYATSAQPLMGTQYGHIEQSSLPPLEVNLDGSLTRQVHIF